MSKLLFLPLLCVLACTHALAVDTTDMTPATVRVCAGPCEEQADLKRSIERIKANGNKHVAGAY